MVWKSDGLRFVVHGCVLSLAHRPRTMCMYAHLTLAVCGASGSERSPEGVCGRRRQRVSASAHVKCAIWAMRVAFWTEVRACGTRGLLMHGVGVW